ncbi:Na(+)-translocating NADH-quinone reductase subunit C [Enterobacteriaceae bacterium YMB-R22]|uniref:Na(+)-translocating NADH-quinone reductase subunit C n=1 Tax=Tenebrionicola larvae TaxID=2815733 RepID=UPI00201230E2|nr:Na(+)-translocating NADH-quinone reductase subunit C [Tenebrionicola larvae]MBV4413728.1 Na(+)-translocating NADH-quinone reductase subunit C [Tenebrionicola larvae]
MANKGNDSTGKTLLVVLVLCLVCSVIVSGAAVGLKSRQHEQRELDKQRNILSVAGLMQPGMSSDEVQAVFSKRISARLVDLQSGDILDKDPAAFNEAQALRDPEQSLTLTAQQDPAGIKRRANIAEVWLVHDEHQTKVKELILPIYGNGLWSVMYAFVALETDGRTIRGMTYYDHGETPGLGGEIENPNWLKLFAGKQVVDENGRPSIRVVKGRARVGSAYEVDGLSGATLTSKGVQHSFEFWMGELGFGPFLKQVREGALNNG